MNVMTEFCLIVKQLDQLCCCN